MKSFFLYLVVFVAGAAVLALEILGTRVLGPFYGVSIFLWSALITVTLIALSAGYALGGRWADRGPRRTRLYLILAGAGFWTLLIPWIKHPVLLVSEPFGLRSAVLIAALILFLPPLTLLGMVSPYAIRLKASSLDVVGRAAGDLYAVSTVGGVVSALLTGFILIPSFGVVRLTYAIGAALMITVSAGLFLERRPRLHGVAIVALLGLVPLFLLPGNSADKERGLIAVVESPYAEIRVIDMNNRRHLVIDGGVHTIVDPLSGRSRFPYTAVLDLTNHFFNSPGDLLLVGLGGGSVVKNFARAGWTVEAVEIDPVVTEMARAHFDLKDGEAVVHEMDGRRFLKARKKGFDLIVMDAFGSSSIPFHLTTKEAFGLIASRLKPDGVFALNLESRSWDDRIVRSLAATLRTRFEHVLALPAHPERLALGNMVFFASQNQLVMSDDSGPADQVGEFAWENRHEPAIDGAPILTDDLNPVDLWSEEINLSARRSLHDYFAANGLSW